MAKLRLFYSRYASGSLAIGDLPPENIYGACDATSGNLHLYTQTLQNAEDLPEIPGEVVATVDESKLIVFGSYRGEWFPRNTVLADMDTKGLSPNEYANVLKGYKEFFYSKLVPDGKQERKMFKLVPR